MHGKKSFWLLCVLSACCSFFTADGHAQLIEPTRSLQSAAEGKGLRKVLSEPPGLEVHVDRRHIGETPIFSARLPAGARVLRIQDAEIDISLASGRTTAISWFKGRFIQVPEKVEPLPEMAHEPRPPPAKPKTDEVPGVRQGAASDPYYWPLNPRGPIY
jgi:hypothetical protein